MTCAACGQRVKAGKRGECPACGGQVAPDVTKVFEVQVRRAQEQRGGRKTDDRVVKAGSLGPGQYVDYTDDWTPGDEAEDAANDHVERNPVQGDLTPFEVTLVNKAAQITKLDPVIAAEDVTPGHVEALRTLAFNVPAYAEEAGKLVARINSGT